MDSGADGLIYIVMCLVCIVPIMLAAGLSRQAEEDAKLKKHRKFRKDTDAAQSNRDEHGFTDTDYHQMLDMFDDK
jgi:hypothetical protein